MSEKMGELLASKATVSGRRISKKVEVLGASESQNGGKINSKDRYPVQIDKSLKKSVSTRSFVEKKVHPLLEAGLSPSNGTEVARKLSNWDTKRKNSSMAKLTHCKSPDQVVSFYQEEQVF